MIDKGTVIGCGVWAASRAIEFLPGILAQVAPSAPAGQIPIDYSNLTANGALIFLVVWITTRTIPALVKDFREETAALRAENALLRADRDKERDRVVCKFEGENR